MGQHIRPRSGPRITGPQAVAALVGGGAGLASAVCLRLCAGSPWAIFCRLSAGRILPPLWLLSLVFVGWFCLVGAGLGLLLSDGRRPPVAEGGVWRGTTCLLASVALTCLWYTLLFAKNSLLFSWICLPLAVALALLTLVSWWRPAPLYVLLAGGYALWLLCLFFWQGAVILHH